jgi:hypothetical protein
VLKQMSKAMNNFKCVQEFAMQKLALPTPERQTFKRITNMSIDKYTYKRPASSLRSKSGGGRISRNTGVKTVMDNILTRI